MDFTSPFDMEPLRGVILVVVGRSNAIVLSCNSTMHIGTNPFIFPSTRLRGGGDRDPNIKKDSFDIPYLSKSNFFWSGLPMLDFQEIIMSPLHNGLASTSAGSDTLLRTAQRTDRGGILGNPNRAASLRRGAPIPARLPREQQ